jgi:hypothetical protein
LALTRKEIQARYREKNRERINEKRRLWYDSEYHHQWYLKNKDKVLTQTRASKKKLRDTNPLKHLVIYRRGQAKLKGVEFNITEEDLFIPDVCPILGIPIFFTEGKRTKNTPSIDRIDNSKGYIPGNVRIISLRANTLKSELDIETLERIIAYIKGEI